MNIIFVGGSVISKEIEDMTTDLLNILANKDVWNVKDTRFTLIDLDLTTFEKFASKKYKENNIGDIVPYKFKSGVKIKKEKNSALFVGSGFSSTTVIEKYHPTPNKINKFTKSRLKVLMRGLKFSQLIVVVPEKKQSRGIIALKFALIHSIPYIDLTAPDTKKRIAVMKSRMEKLRINKENEEKRTKEAIVRNETKKNRYINKILKKGNAPFKLHDYQPNLVKVVMNMKEGIEEDEDMEVPEEYWDMEKQYVKPWKIDEPVIYLDGINILHKQGNMPPAPPPAPMPKPLITIADIIEFDIPEVPNNPQDIIETVCVYPHQDDITIYEERAKYCVGRERIITATNPENLPFFNRLNSTLQTIQKQYQNNEMTIERFGKMISLIAQGKIIYVGIKLE